MKPPVAPRRPDEAIALMAKPADSGQAFFETAVEALALGLGCRWAVVGELVDTGDAVRVLAFWNGTELADPFTYSLAGGPCEVVYATNRDDVHHFYPSGVTRLFPEFDLLADLGAEAYRGELFLDSAGRPAGHVVALMSEPESDSAEIRALFRLIAQRVGAEFRRWKLDAALARSEERYRRLLDFLPDCVVIHRDGRVIYANSSATDALGAARRKEVVGRPSLDLTHPDEWEAAGQRMGLSASGAEVTRETTRRYKRMDGTWFTGESSEVRVDFDDGVSTVDVFRDVTQRHRLQEELLQAKKLEAVGKLTGGVAHDFNNLLAVIRGNIDVLAAEGATQERVGAIVRATERGAELTDRLLSFARRQTLVPTTIELPDLFEDFGTRPGHTLGEDYRISIGSMDGCSPVLADTSQLQTAILNLALNGRDAMESGGTVTIDASNVTVATPLALPPSADRLAPGEYVAIRVSDSGGGMPPESVGRVFEPFFTTKADSGGSGLGLSMVYGFARQSGGGTAISSGVGAGTTVTLYLPKSDAPPVPSTDFKGPDLVESLVAHGERVLVVEDQVDVLERVETMLSSYGYEVVTASDVPSARALLDGQDRVDLVLIDIVLNGPLTGHDLALGLVESRPALAILLMSGLREADDGVVNPAVRNLPMLQKPFAAEELAAACRQALGAGGDSSDNT